MDVHIEACIDSQHLQELLMLAFRVLFCYDAYALMTYSEMRGRRQVGAALLKDAKKVIANLEQTIDERFMNVDDALPRAYHAATVSVLAAGMLNQRVLTLLNKKS